MVDTRNFSDNRYANAQVGPSTIPRLGLYEHILDDTGGGSDTAALSSSGLGERGISDRSIGYEIRLGEDVYVLAKAADNTAMGPGTLGGPDVSANDALDTTLDNAYDTSNGAAGGAAGSTVVTLYDASVFASLTADLWADGYLVVTEGGGAGYKYKIKSHPATSSSATTLAFTLYDPIAVALSSTSDFEIIGNIYKNIVNYTSGTDAKVSGVILPTISADGAGIGQFFWLQVEGVAAVLCEDTPAAGDVVTSGDATDGACQLQDAYTEVPIGQALGLGVANQHLPVKLNIR